MNDLTALKYELEKEKALLVYFFKDDCAVCKSIRPKVETLILNSFPKMHLKFISSKSHPEIPVAFGIYANPAILIFFEGKEFKRFSKYISIEEMRSDIKRIYDLLFEN